MSKKTISFTLNGKPVTMEVEPRTTLLRALRDYGVTSVKRGCEEGECGTCTVIMDGKLQKSCMVLAQEAEGREVMTAEGLVSKDGKLHPVQQAFIEEGAIQCGFCTPGMVLAVYDLLKRNPNPTDQEMKVALSGNLCRCTGYEGIFRAVRKAAKMMSCCGA
ncbi:aerobic-type carbon monoxide dehydrogenase, small subunit CoxS/CutS-like protein [Thermanaerovibrio velox DSM 12556]|uniref:Aerobic-type carbon monoxide dehydrogenase, small subunit CoxS/CutS-like protein n=1 Tax=Thermanaerovibrio velox DSM 12556 TaxID=926567 RepID=H0UP07_9BACT|nr:(2Fe-2S)-binding protein [Thermanaerovibrio velox]EHM10510.1 aerobic-type carbon monoxide dehydrogenase, small subunit CoxS/CutS-like protein [Thermanaerovibrio velox DSM 12556]